MKKKHAKYSNVVQFNWSGCHSCTTTRLRHHFIKSQCVLAIVYLFSVADLFCDLRMYIDAHFHLFFVHSLYAFLLCKLNRKGLAKTWTERVLLDGETQWAFAGRWCCYMSVDETMQCETHARFAWISLLRSRVCVVCLTWALSHHYRHHSNPNKRSSSFVVQCCVRIAACLKCGRINKFQHAAWQNRNIVVLRS